MFEEENNSSGGVESIPQTIPIVSSEQASEDVSTKVKKLGKLGRKRRYEEPGIEDIPPVKEVVVFRFKMGRHYPGLSKDMEDWFEHYYFTKPTRAEREKDAREHERHVKSWERGRKWIAEECGIEALGDSRKIVAIRKRSTS
ncbi:MAG: hypothetical protein ACJ788_24435 [Ktedonobacteraceae bacterium]